MTGRTSPPGGRDSSGGSRSRRKRRRSRRYRGTGACRGAPSPGQEMGGGHHRCGAGRGNCGGCVCGAGHCGLLDMGEQPVSDPGGETTRYCLGVEDEMRASNGTYQTSDFICLSQNGNTLRIFYRDESGNDARVILQEKGIWGDWSVVGDMDVLANGENTFYEKNKNFQKSLHNGYIGFESDSQCFFERKVTLRRLQAGSTEKVRPSER